jgi:hypothetical protein
MGFYARILIRKVIINNGDFMIEELNKKLKSMYLEPRTKLRVDVDYVVGRLEHIVEVATHHEIDAESQVDGYDYLVKDIEEFLNELKQNMENHNGN